MNYKHLYLFIIILLSTHLAQAQTGKVTIKGDAGVQALVDKHIAYNKNLKGFPGFRVQIFFESGNYSKSRAYGEKSKFSARYPEVESYVIYQEPYYKVRVGNFRNRVEAEAFKQRILEEWPEAYIVKDDIQMPAVYKPEKFN